jgi:CO/xanthine dehydrogenase Mo-binding subunit
LHAGALIGRALEPNLARMQRSVGGRIARPEGPDKVSGRARYVADLHFDNAWYGGSVRSNVARGRLLGFDFAQISTSRSVASSDRATFPARTWSR